MRQGRGGGRRRLGAGLVVLAVLVGIVACSADDEDGRDIGGTATAGRPFPAATPGAIGSPLSIGTGTAMPVGPVGTPAAAGTPGGDGFRTAAAEGGAVVWAMAVDPTTKEPTEQVASFPADARAIYAAVPLARLEPGTTLTASWTYNRTPLQGLVGSVTAPAEVAAGASWVAFELARRGEEPWPAGTYAVTVAVNGEAALTAEVEVGVAAAAG